MSTTSRPLTKSSALEPEKPVRYRMFGRLVTSSPSIWAAVRPSASADRRRGRGSSTGRELPRQTAKSELVPVGAESHDDANRGGREHGVPALRLARVDVGEVHLDERQLDRRQRVADRQAACACTRPR